MPLYNGARWTTAQPDAVSATKGLDFEHIDFFYHSCSPMKTIFVRLRGYSQIADNLSDENRHKLNVSELTKNLVFTDDSLEKIPRKSGVTPQLSVAFLDSARVSLITTFRTNCSMGLNGPLPSSLIFWTEYPYSFQ